MCGPILGTGKLPGMPVQEGRGPWCLTNSQTWALPLAAVDQEGLTDHDEAGLAWTQLLLYSQQVPVGQQHHPTLPRLTNKSHFTQDMPDFGIESSIPWEPATEPGSNTRSVRTHNSMDRADREVKTL